MGTNYAGAAGFTLPGIDYTLTKPMDLNGAIWKGVELGGIPQILKQRAQMDKMKLTGGQVGPNGGITGTYMTPEMEQAMQSRMAAQANMYGAHAQSYLNGKPVNQGTIDAQNARIAESTRHNQAMEQLGQQRVDAAGNKVQKGDGIIHSTEDDTELPTNPVSATEVPDNSLSQESAPIENQVAQTNVEDQTQQEKNDSASSAESAPVVAQAAPPVSDEGMTQDDHTALAEHHAAKAAGLILAQNPDLSLTPDTAAPSMAKAVASDVTEVPGAMTPDAFQPKELALNSPQVESPVQGDKLNSQLDPQAVAIGGVSPKSPISDYVDSIPKAALLADSGSLSDRSDVGMTPAQRAAKGSLDAQNPDGDLKPVVAQSQPSVSWTTGEPISGQKATPTAPARGAMNPADPDAALKAQLAATAMPDSQQIPVAKAAKPAAQQQEAQSAPASQASPVSIKKLSSGHVIAQDASGAWWSNTGERAVKTSTGWDVYPVSKGTKPAAWRMDESGQPYFIGDGGKGTTYLNGKEYTTEAQREKLNASGASPQAFDRTKASALMDLDNTLTNMNRLLGTPDKANDPNKSWKGEHPGLGGWGTGFMQRGPQAFLANQTNDAANFHSLNKSIQDGFVGPVMASLKSMMDMALPGGAKNFRLTQGEIMAAKTALANLDQTQSPTEFRKSARQALGLLQGMRDKLDSSTYEDPKQRANQGRGIPQTQSAQPAPKAQSQAPTQAAPTSDKFTVGTVYTDKNGNRATYRGNGKWE